MHVDLGNNYFHNVKMSQSSPKNGMNCCRGRPREFNLEHVLDKVICLFRQQGYHATSISDIASASGLTTGSIYKAFIDKRGVFLAALNRYIEQRRNHIQKLLAAQQTGRQKIQAMLDDYVELSSQQEGRYGCLVISCAVDLAVFDSEIQQLVRDTLQYNEALIHRLIKEAQTDGSICKQVNAETTARMIYCLLLGMRVSAKTGQAQTDMAAVAKQTMKLLD